MESGARQGLGYVEQCLCLTKYQFNGHCFLIITFRIL